MLFLLARRFSNGVVALVAWFIWLIAPAALRFRPSYFSEVTTGAIWLVAWWTLLAVSRDGRASLARGARGARRVGWHHATGDDDRVRRFLSVSWCCGPCGSVARGVTSLAALPLALAICAIVPLWGHRVLGGWGKNPYAYYQTRVLPGREPGPGHRLDAAAARAAGGHGEVQRLRASHARGAHRRRCCPQVLEARLLELRRGMWGDSLLPVSAGHRRRAGDAAAGRAGVRHVCAGGDRLSLDRASAVLADLLPGALPGAGVPVGAGALAVRDGRGGAGAESGGPRAGRSALPALVTCVALVCWLVAGRASSRSRSGTCGSRWRRGYHESFQQLLAKIPDRKAVVFVRYAPNADVHLSLTNNEPDASSARVWAVHDLGDANLRLLQAAPDRTPYLYEELPDRHVLRPFPIPDEWRSKLTRRVGAVVSWSLDTWTTAASRCSVARQGDMEPQRTPRSRRPSTFRAASVPKNFARLHRA